MPTSLPGAPTCSVGAPTLGAPPVPHYRGAVRSRPPTADRPAPGRVCGRVPPDLLAVAAGIGLVGAAAVVGRRLLADGVELLLPFPPLLAQWLPHAGLGTPVAVVTAVAVCWYGPGWRPTCAGGACS